MPQPLLTPDDWPAQPVFRFAPSPNGYLHLGHARSAIVGHDWARATGGRFLLRIEDIDVARVRETYVAAIMEDLAWLGVDWDGPVLRQSLRFDVYAEAAGRLREQGLLYPCRATRGEIAALADQHGLGCDPDGAPRFERRAAGGRYEGVQPAAGSMPPVATAWRLDMARALGLMEARGERAALGYTAVTRAGVDRWQPADPSAWGDVVLIRKDTPASYHLAVVVDDAAQGVTHVTRGADLLAATDLHRLLQVLLALPAPLYHHHPLITDDKGRKLAKRAGDLPLRQLRASGISAADVRRRAMAGL